MCCGYLILSQNNRMGKNDRLGDMCYERTRDQGTLGSIAVAIVEPLGGHLLYILLVT
jgi:hypothetical protein